MGSPDAKTQVAEYGTPDRGNQQRNYAVDPWGQIKRDRAKIYVAPGLDLTPRFSIYVLRSVMKAQAQIRRVAAGSQDSVFWVAFRHWIVLRKGIGSE